MGEVEMKDVDALLGKKKGQGKRDEEEEQKMEL